MRPIDEANSSIGIVMSSDKDLPRMREGAEFLNTLGIPFEMTAISPYRVPDQVREYGVGAESSGYEVIMAGSGEFLAREVMRHPMPPPRLISVAERLGQELSSAACAYAVAVLLRERETVSR